MLNNDFCWSNRKKLRTRVRVDFNTTNYFSGRRVLGDHVHPPVPISYGEKKEGSHVQRRIYGPIKPLKKQCLLTWFFFPSKLLPFLRGTPAGGCTSRWTASKFRSSRGRTACWCPVWKNPRTNRDSPRSRSAGCGTRSNFWKTSKNLHIGT